MLKDFFRFSMNETARPETVVEPPGSPDHTRALAKLAEEFDRGAAVTVMSAPAAGTSVPVDKHPSFDQIYQTAAVKPPRLSYSILKVSDMLNSHHLAAMSSEAKRSSLLMALEAAGRPSERLIQVAPKSVVRKTKGRKSSWRRRDLVT
jgi:hypothetical protein